MDELYHKRLAAWGRTERFSDIAAEYYHQIDLLDAVQRLLVGELKDLQTGGQTDERILRDYLGNACRGLGRMAVMLQLVACSIDPQWRIEGWVDEGEQQKITELNQTIRMRRLRESFGDCAEDFIHA